MSIKLLLNFFTISCAGFCFNTQAATPFDNTIFAIEQTMQAHIYDPAVLSAPAYLDVKAKIRQLAAESATEADFIEGFNRLWVQGPFSHVQLLKSDKTAQQMAEFVDAMEVGGTGAQLRFEQNTAILTVSTMMGRDTIAQINAAYQTMAEQKPAALIIDLRGNPGGAFAVKPLVSHLLKDGLDAGIFVSQKWTSQHHQLPSVQTIAAVKPWQGWSLPSFWRDVQENAITRVRFEPQQPVYPGKVYVLISQTTASAAELAADAMRTSGRVVLIGERTAGTLLSQKPYDLGQGLQLFLPIAEYVSSSVGRIEGKGVQPDISVPAEQALTRALQAINR